VSEKERVKPAILFSRPYNFQLKCLITKATSSVKQWSKKIYPQAEIIKHKWLSSSYSAVRALYFIHEYLVALCFRDMSTLNFDYLAVLMVL